MSQFQTLQFSMTLDRWWRERERDQLYAGADGGLRPLPLRTVSLDAFFSPSCECVASVAWLPERESFVDFCMRSTFLSTTSTEQDLDVANIQTAH